MTALGTDQPGDKLPSTPGPWQQRLGESIGLPFPLLWLLVGAILLGLAIPVLSLCEHSWNCLNMVIISAALVAATGNAVILYYNLMTRFGVEIPRISDMPRAALASWYGARMRRTFADFGTVACGVVLGAAVVAVSFQAGPVFTTWQGRIVHALLFFLIGLNGGAMLFVMAGIAAVVYHLGRSIRIHVSPFHSHRGTPRAPARLMFTVSAVAVCIYLLGVLLLPFIHHERGALQIVVPAAFGILALLYFVGPQLAIRAAYENEKVKLIERLVPRLEEAFRQVETTPTPENLKHLRDLLDLQDVMNQRPSGMLGFKEILALVGTVLVPVAIAAAQLIWGK